MHRFLWIAVIAACCGLSVQVASAEPGKYLGPRDIVASQDGATLYVLCVDANQVAVVEATGGKVAKTIAVPTAASGLCLSPDGSKLYVTSATPQGSVSVVDLASGKVSATIPAGHSACAPVVSPDGKRLYVSNRFNNNVSVIDLDAKKEVARVPAGRDPNAAAITPDGKTVAVANLLPNDRADSYDVAATITLIDTAANQPATVRLLNGSTSVRGIAVSPDGKYAYAVHILARYQMPTTQLERGWMNTNALTIIDLAGKKLVNTFLLDDVDLGAANPCGVGVTADGKTVCVSHAGTHELSVIDMTGVMAKLEKIPAKAVEPGKGQDRTYSSSPTQSDVPNDLAFLVDLRKRVKLKAITPWGTAIEGGPMVNGPRGVAVAGAKAYVALYFSDNLAAVDLSPKPEKQVAWIPLGPSPELTAVRRGQMHFNDADLCFQHWQSCESCHPDARVDALNWDLMNDGMGNPKNNKSMLLVHKTPPAMSEGVRQTAEQAVRSGITHIQFAVRPDEDAQAIDEYLKSLQPVPSPYLVNGELSESAKRGKVVYEKLNCNRCHPAPTYTDLQMHDVESKGAYDRRNDFDTPTLVEVWRTAPYLHDGRYVTMKEVIKEGKHGYKHGDVEKLSEQELNDLVEFVLSL